MTKRKKWVTVVFSLIAALLVGGYFAIPVISQRVIQHAIKDAQGISVQQVSVRWSGPQLLTGLLVETDRTQADLDVEIENGLFSLFVENKPIKLIARGDATIVLLDQDVATDPVPSTSEKIISKPKSGKSLSIPKLEIEIKLASLTIQGDDALVYHNVVGSFDVDPSRHFVASLSGETDLGGTIEASFNAPTLIDETGKFNPEASGSLSFSIDNASLPTINGVSGWSIVKLQGEVSSPNVSKSLSLGATGSLAEFDQERGSIFVKTQLTKTEVDGPFTFGNWAVVGMVDISDVPTTILSPFLQIVNIDTVRDLGPTMDFSLSRNAQNAPPVASFNTRNVNISGTLDPDQGVLSNVDITAKIHNELLTSLSDGVLSGNPILKLHFDRLVPVGDDDNTLSGHLSLNGPVNYRPAGVVIDEIHADIDADVNERFIATSGRATIDGQSTTFKCELHSPNKNKLDGIDDLWKTIANQLPRGDGKVLLQNVPSALLRPYITDKRIDLSRDIGEQFDVSAHLLWDRVDATFLSAKVKSNATIHVEGKTFVEIRDLDITAVIDKQLATEFTGTTIAATTTVHLLSKSVGFDGNSTFDMTLDIGKHHTVILGQTTRTTEGTNAGNLDLQISATGIDTHLLDAICNFGGTLVDSIGSPVKVNKLFIKNVFNNPTITLDCKSPTASFTSKLIFTSEDELISTDRETPTRGKLELTVELSKRVFKNLGPLLGDIVSVAKLVQVNINQATTSLDGDPSKLNGHITIDIGKASVDSNSLTMQLLTMFDPGVGTTIPVFFEPIDIQIRNGIATYDEFRLTIANRFTILQTGTINLNTKELRLKSIVPLTSLGYNIKELRGLDTDIDVVLLITGTIDDPKVRVDPSFDLGKLLLELGAGKILDDVLGGDNEAPNPLDILKELLNKRN